MKLHVHAFCPFWVDCVDDDAHCCGFSVFMGMGGCGRPISARVAQIATACNSSLPERIKCPPAWLHAFGLLRYDVSLGMARIILLALYVIIVSPYVVAK